MAISDTGREEPSEGVVGHDETEAEAAAMAGVGAEIADFDPPQLELGDEDVRLPWLEGDEDELEDERGPGVGQALLLVLLGLVAIGLIVGGLFWATRNKVDEELVADGGVISAPAEPYKARPDDPGGEVVAGTGDTSFAVAEGQSRQVSIDGDGAADAEPGFTAPEKADAPAAPKTPATPAASGVGVQVGAYSTREAAEAGWNALKTEYPALSGMSHRVLQGQADIGTVFRLQAVPGDLAAARGLCSGMKAAGLSCQVKN